MPFQFQCPQGHLLEGDESQAGQTCQCPMCGMAFIIPAPIAMPAAPQMPAPAQPFGHDNPAIAAPQSYPQFAEPQQPGLPHAGPALAPGQIGPPFSPGPQIGPQFGPQVGPPAETAPPAAPVVAAPEEPKLLHIPCPKGHELETPLEMLNQEVLCPHCGVQFRLREKDSVEYKRKQQEELERRYERSGKLWFNWAIAIAVLITIFLVVLIAMQASR